MPCCKSLGWGALLLVACTSNDDAASGPPGNGSGKPNPEEPATLPGSQVFVDDQVLEFRFTLEDEDWTYLEEHGNEELYVPAALVVRGSHLKQTTYASVGLRHKGAYSLHHCWDDFGGVRYRGADEGCAKLSWKVKFDEYEADSRLDGLKRINLHASGDVTKLRELVAYATFNEFGVNAPRATPAKVSVNGELQGIFIAVEEVDGRYTKAHFPEGPDGNLYKEIWPSPLSDSEDFLEALQTNEEAADVSGMVRFTEAIEQTSTSTFVADMAAWVDLDAVLRYMAVDRAMRNWDGINAFYAPNSPHNFYWYQDDGAEGRFHLIPWDLDNTFWEFDPFMYPEQWATAEPVPDWNAEPLNCRPRSVWTPDSGIEVTPPRCDKFLDLLAETSWERFAELALQLREGPFSVEKLTEKADRFRRFVEPLVREDPVIDVEEWETEVARLPRLFEEAARDFDAFVAAGLVEEPESLPDPELPSEVLDATTTDAGLHVHGITNFEFLTSPSDEVAGVYRNGQYTSSSARWNTQTPLSGSADLRFDFTFNREPGAYNEWVELGIGCSETDVTRYSEIVLTLASDSPRTVRVRVASGAYAEELQGIWTEFGDEVSVAPEPRTIVIPFRSLYYPPWAKEAWSGAQGWEPEGEDAARVTTLRRFTGLLFSPFSNVDSAGELLVANEDGHLRIDNIYLR